MTYPLGKTDQINSKTDITKFFTSEDRVVQSLDFHFASPIKEVVSFHRGVVEEEQWRQHPNSSGFQKSVPNAHFDEIGFLETAGQYGSNSAVSAELDPDTIVAVTKIINDLAVASTFVGQHESATTLSDIVAGQIGDLRKLHLEMTKGLAAAQKEADKRYLTRREMLENEIAEKTSQLTQQESQLEARRQELNDREPQHERRRLREHLTSRLQEEISRPRSEGRAYESRVYFVYLLVGLAFVLVSATLTISSGAQTAAGSAFFWASTTKSVVAGLAGGAFIWAGLSGLKAAAIAARRYEEAIQRYGFDMDRASWIVETILQMNAAEEVSVPTQWLESVCRDLFVNQDASPDEHKSLEAFAALFDATAKARIGTNGIEFEIDKRGARKLARD